MFQVDRYTQLVGGGTEQLGISFCAIFFLFFLFESDSAVLLNPLKEIKF